MARTLNFDAVIVETIDVTKAGRTYHLREDVPMTVMVRAFALMEHQASVRGRNDISAREMETWLAELQAMTLRLCGDIWRHSLPETTDDELRALFTFDEQMQLVMLFFTTRSLKSQQQVNALNASSPTGTEQTPVAPVEPLAPSTTSARSATANRQQRRGAAAGTSQRKR